MRTNWFRYFMDIAKQVATRATCDRKHVGAVLVTQDKTIIATGYNGSIHGAPHCDEVGHMMEDSHCTRTIHAEVNALSQAARNGVAVKGATLYCTALPCWSCFKQICNAGIAQIIYDEPYRAAEHLKRVFEHADYANVRVFRLDFDDTLKSDRPMDDWVNQLPQ
jgi:dCMP deaminase